MMKTKWIYYKFSLKNEVWKFRRHYLKKWIMNKLSCIAFILRLLKNKKKNIKYFSSCFTNVSKIEIQIFEIITFSLRCVCYPCFWGAVFSHLRCPHFKRFWTILSKLACGNASFSKAMSRLFPPKHFKIHSKNKNVKF